MMINGFHFSFFLELKNTHGQTRKVVLTKKNEALLSVFWRGCLFINHYNFFAFCYQKKDNKLEFQEERKLTTQSPPACFLVTKCIYFSITKIFVVQVFLKFSSDGNIWTLDDAKNFIRTISKELIGAEWETVQSS